MKRARTIVAVLAMASALALIAAGCGSSGGSDSSEGDSGTKTDKAPVALEGKVNNEGTKDISGDGKDAELEMEMDDYYFGPTFVKAAPGAKVKVELENEGKVPHTFTTADGSVDEKVEPGKKATVTVTVPDSGSLSFKCDFHGAMGMQGAFYTGTGDSSSSGGSGDMTTTTKASKDGY